MRKIVAVAAAAVTLAACGSEALDDAPVGIIDDSPVFVITNADEFPNMAMKCYEGSLIVTTTRDFTAFQLYQDHPACEDGNPVPEGEE